MDQLGPPDFATYDEPEPFPSRRVADRRPGILYPFHQILWTDVKRVRFTSGYLVTYNMLPSEGHVSLLSTMPPPIPTFILTRKPEPRF